METIVMCVVALLLGMLLANMLKSVCGCKKVVIEGKGENRHNMCQNYVNDFKANFKANFQNSPVVQQFLENMGAHCDYDPDMRGKILPDRYIDMLKSK